MDKNIVKDRMSAAPATDMKEEKEEIASRRTVLRGALVVGCSLWAPIILSGCDSKKDAGPSAASSNTPKTSAAPASTTAPAASKATQASVQYQGQPKNDQMCSQCRNFIAETKTCKVVEGSISPDGWCSLWARMG